MWADFVTKNEVSYFNRKQTILLPLTIQRKRSSSILSAATCHSTSRRRYNSFANPSMKSTAVATIHVLDINVKFNSWSTELKSHCWRAVTLAVPRTDGIQRRFYATMVCTKYITMPFVDSSLLAPKVNATSIQQQSPWWRMEVAYMESDEIKDAMDQKGQSSNGEEQESPMPHVSKSRRNSECRITYVLYVPSKSARGLWFCERETVLSDVSRRKTLGRSFWPWTDLIFGTWTPKRGNHGKNVKPYCQTLSTWPSCLSKSFPNKQSHNETLHFIRLLSIQLCQYHRDGSRVWFPEKLIL